MTWQKIETLPKDGQRVLLWSGGTGKWPITGRWCEGGFSRTGWLGMDAPMLGVPSHWMPLPPAPPEET
jgi:Protein of unknown function (DUF551)